MVVDGPAMSDTAQELSDPFRIVSINSAAAPSGEAGTGWYRYEIKQGPNRIVGYRAGGIDLVTDAVELMVTRLNERRYHRRGRVHVVLDSRSASKPADKDH